MEKYITVESLYKTFATLIDNGYGNMKLSVDGIKVKKDELAFLYGDNPEMQIRICYPFRDDCLKATNDLKNDIQKLINEYHIKLQNIKVQF